MSGPTDGQKDGQTNRWIKHLIQLHFATKNIKVVKRIAREGRKGEAEKTKIEKSIICEGGKISEKDEFPKSISLSPSKLWKTNPREKSPSGI